MTKASIQQFSGTPSSNTDIAGINVNVGWPPSNVGSAFRTLMAFLADCLIPTGININGLFTYTLSATQASAVYAEYTGALSGDCTVTIPNAVFVGLVTNATTGGHNVILASGGGTTATVPPSSAWYFVLCDGVGNVSLLPLGAGTLTIAGSGGIAGNATLGGTNPNPVGNAVNGWEFLTTGSAIGYSVNGVPLNIGTGAFGGGAVASFYYTTAAVGSITVNGAVTSYNTTSDQTLKLDDGRISEKDAGLIIDRLAPRWFRFKSDPDASPTPGFFAQQVAKVFPWAVTRGVSRPGRKGYRPWQMDDGKMMPVVITELQSIRRRLAKAKL